MAISDSETIRSLDATSKDQHWSNSFEYLYLNRSPYVECCTRAIVSNRYNVTIEQVSLCTILCMTTLEQQFQLMNRSPYATYYVCFTGATDSLM